MQKTLQIPRFHAECCKTQVFGTIPCGGGGVVANREPGSYICLYLIPVKLSLEGTSFPCPYPLSFFSWHAPILCCLISTYFISPYQLRCCVLEIGWPRPLPTGPTHSTGGAGYHCSIYILNLSTLSLRYLIWSSFQSLILTYILVTYISIHACLAWNQLSSSYPTSYIAVGWRLADASPFPGPTHSTGGGGVDGLWPWPWQGGWGGDPEPGTYIYIFHPGSPVFFVRTTCKKYGNFGLPTKKWQET